MVPKHTALFVFSPKNCSPTQNRQTFLLEFQTQFKNVDTDLAAEKSSREMIELFVFLGKLFRVQLKFCSNNCMREVTTDFWTRKQNGVHCDRKSVFENVTFHWLHQTFQVEVERSKLLKTKGDCSPFKPAFPALENFPCSVWNRTTLNPVFRSKICERTQNPLYESSKITKLDVMAVGSGGLYAAPTVSLLKKIEENLLTHHPYSQHTLRYRRISEFEDWTTFILPWNSLLRTLSLLLCSQIKSVLNFPIRKESALLSNLPPLFLRRASLVSRKVWKWKGVLEQILSHRSPKQPYKSSKITKLDVMAVGSGGLYAALTVSCERRIWETRLHLHQTSYQSYCDIDGFLIWKTGRRWSQRKIYHDWWGSRPFFHSTGEQVTIIESVLDAKGDCSAFKLGFSVLENCFCSVWRQRKKNRVARNKILSSQHRTRSKISQNYKARCDGSRKWRTLRCSHSFFAKGGFWEIQSNSRFLLERLTFI